MKIVSTMCRRLRTGRGFTLIEMLIVIAIIALLAALLVPSVTKALRRAVSMHCMNNLSQNGKAIDLYITDHEEYYPSYPSSNGIYASQVADCKKSTTQLGYYLQSYLGTKNMTIKYEPTFTCPGTMKLEPLYKGNVQYLLNHSARLLASNSPAEDPWGYPDEPDPIKKLPKKRTLSSSREWALMDVDQMHWSINPGWGNYDNFAPYPGHVDRWNALFFDWHVGVVFP